MSYVDDHLIPGEQVVYRAHLHKLALVGPVLAALALWAVGVVLALYGYVAIGAGVFALSAIPLVAAYISYASSEFAVTDKRVIIKTGWIRRKTVELLLGQVEAIGVEQGIVGRVLDYGSITVTGTGGSNERFQGIASPLEFRRQVHGQVSAGHAPPLGAGAEGGVRRREERDCPHCAEPILVRARVCKHCGHAVEPLTAG